MLCIGHILIFYEKTMGNISSEICRNIQFPAVISSPVDGPQAVLNIRRPVYQRGGLVVTQLTAALGDPGSNPGSR